MTSFLTPTLGLTEGVQFGIGYRQLESVVSPAVGQPFSHRLDGAYDYRLLAISATFTTSATVATRIPYFSFSDEDGNEIFSVWSALGIAASLSNRIQWVLGYPANESVMSDVGQAPIPDIILSGGFSVGVSAYDLQAGDSITMGPMYLEKYPHGPEGYPTGNIKVAVPKAAKP